MSYSSELSAGSGASPPRGLVARASLYKFPNTILPHPHGLITALPYWRHSLTRLPLLANKCQFFSSIYEPGMSRIVAASEKFVRWLHHIWETCRHIVSSWSSTCYANSFNVACFPFPRHCLRTASDSTSDTMWWRF